jgi:hypothetical protein
MPEKLTPGLIQKFKKLDEPSQKRLADFAKRFPNSSIEWLPRSKPNGATPLKRERAPEGQVYVFVDIDECRAAGHRFKTVWSDKTPKKVHLLCIHCTEDSGVSAFVAFSEPELGFGTTWRSRTKHPIEEPPEELHED